MNLSGGSDFVAFVVTPEGFVDGVRGARRWRAVNRQMNTLFPVAKWLDAVDLEVLNVEVFTHAVPGLSIGPSDASTKRRNYQTLGSWPFCQSESTSMLTATETCTTTPAQMER